MSKLVKCRKCGYEWQPDSELQLVTCPSCYGKTPNEPAEEAEVEA